MHRIDTADSVDGRFDDGDEALGREGTVVDDTWLNAVQEEILAPIVAAGIAPDTADNAQLLAAMRALLAPALPRTGEFVLDLNPTPRTGWVFFDDGTIGPTNSGATTRANNDAHDLFVMLWNNYPNSLLPVSYYGRGTSAEADWDAGRTIMLPRMVGRALALAGNGSGLTNRAAASYTGQERVSLSRSQIPQLSITIGDLINAPGDYINYSPSTEKSFNYGAKTVNTSGTYGYSHENMPPTSFLYARVKL